MSFFRIIHLFCTSGLPQAINKEARGTFEFKVVFRVEALGKYPGFSEWLVFSSHRTVRVCAGFSEQCG